MKCLQCGSELDRLSKWRGTSEFCSEECRKQHQDEFDRLAMRRLMQPRQARVASQPAASPVRTLGSVGGSLTVVTHPVGASSPIVTEPPEAGFLMDAAATLAELQLRHQPPIPPAPRDLCIPPSELPAPDALLALQAILGGLRPSLRSARGFASAGIRPAVPADDTAVQLDVSPPDPVWAPSLGLTFQVQGIESPAYPGLTVTESIPSLSPALPVVDHGPIPSRRTARVYTTPPVVLHGAATPIPAPAVAAPRLRIHLPKPVMTPLRPRYAFAPPPPPTDETSQSGTSASAPATAEPRLPLEGRKMSSHGNRENTKRTAPQKQRTTNAEPTNALTSPPAAVPAPEVEAAAEKTPSVAPMPSATKPLEIVNQTPPPAFTSPSFGASADPETESFLQRVPGWAKALAAVAAVGIGLAAWLVPELNRGTARAASLPPPVAAPATMGAESWETDSAGDTTGIARRRIISLYKPARGKRDYIFEFSGQLEQRAMGWIFRMKDARNYYCLKLEQAEAAGTAQLVKFAVVNGEEQPHRLVELREPLPPGAPVRIRLDVRGQHFSTQVNGKPVDVWIDNQLPAGTVGFSNESGERAIIRSVKVTY